MNVEIQHENVQKGQDEQNWVLQPNRQYKSGPTKYERYMINNYQDKEEQECDEEAFKDSGYGGEWGGEGDGFGGVERGDCEDDCGCGEEREDEEENEVGELDGEEFDPF